MKIVLSFTLLKTYLESEHYFTFVLVLSSFIGCVHPHTHSAKEGLVASAMGLEVD